MGMQARHARRQLAGGALVSLLIQIAGVASAAVTSLVVARATGTHGTASYGLCMALIAAGTVVFGLDFGVGVTFFVSRGTWSPRRACSLVVRLAAALGLFGATVVVILQQLLHGGILRGVTLPMAVAVGLALPFAIGVTFASAVALASERYEAYGIAQGLQAGVSVVAVIALVLAAGATGAVVAVAVSYCVAWAYLQLRLRRQLPRVEAGGEAPVRHALRFGLRAWGSDVLQLINYRLDLFVLNAFVAQSVVGRYALAVSLTALGWVLPAGLQTVLFPRSAAGHEDADGTVRSALRHTFVLITVSVPGIAVLLALVPLIYGKAFAPSTLYGFLLLPGVAAIGFARTLSAVITGRGFPQYSLINALISTPITVALYLALVPPFGAVGAALGSTCSYVLSTVLAMYFFHRVTRVRALEALSSPRAVFDDYVLALRNLRAYVAASSRR